MTFLLYHHPVSTCSQKVRVALAEKGLAFEQYVIDWSIMEHLQDWYLKINPNGVVPTLVHNDEAIIESSVICEYLDDVFPDPPLAPRDALGRARMRAWIRYFEEVPTSAIRAPSFNLLFTKSIKGTRSAQEFEEMTARMPLRKHFYRQMGEEGFAEPVVQESLDRLRACLVRVAKALSDGRPYIMGDAFTIADILLIPTIVRMSDLGLRHLWADLPAIDAWFKAVQARPSFAIAYMPGSRVNPGDYKLSQGHPGADQRRTTA